MREIVEREGHLIRHGVLRPPLLVGGGLSQLTGPASVLAAGQNCRNVACFGKCYSLQEYGQPGLRNAIRQGCWHNGYMPPVLKHGPRSLTSMRVFGCETHTRNESERRLGPVKGCTIDRS